MIEMEKRGKDYGKKNRLEFCSEVIRCRSYMFVQSKPETLGSFAVTVLLVSSYNEFG